MSVSLGAGYDLDTLGAIALFIGGAAILALLAWGLWRAK